MIAVVSYNSLHLFKNDSELRVFRNIFNPKSPDSVHEFDLVFQELILEISCYKKIIVFLGKKSSGSLAMIPLLCKNIDHSKLFFVLCDHDVKEKVSLLERYKVSPHSYLVFKDNNYLEGKRCDEQRILLGLVCEYRLKKADH